MEYYFNLYPGGTWLEFFHKAIEEKKMTLEQAKEFAKDFGPNDAKAAFAKLMSTV